MELAEIIQDAPATMLEINYVSSREEGLGHEISALGRKSPGSKIPTRTSGTKEALSAALWRDTVMAPAVSPPPSALLCALLALPWLSRIPGQQDCPGSGSAQ